MVKRFGLEEYLGSIREVSWISVAIVLIFDLLNLLFFLTQPAALLTVLLPWIFVIGIGIFFNGKQRPVDLGLTIPKILPGILCTITLWLAIQGMFALVLLILEGRLSWGVVPVGYLVDQLIFFAFAEEIIFRGYLFPQFFLKIRKTRTRPLTAVILALLGSQLIFSLSHIPHQLVNGVSWQEIPFQLLLIFIGGLFLCYIYLRSQNLLIAVGAHALGNFPTILFSHDRLPWYVINLTVMLVTFIVIEIWRWYSRSSLWARQ